MTTQNRASRLSRRTAYFYEAFIIARCSKHTKCYTVA